MVQNFDKIFSPRKVQTSVKFKSGDNTGKKQEYTPKI